MNKCTSRRLIHYAAYSKYGGTFINISDERHQVLLPFYAWISFESLISCQSNSIRQSRGTRAMNRKKNGELHRGRIGTKAPGGRREPGNHFRANVPDSGFRPQHAGAVEFPIYLILAYGKKEMGVYILRSRYIGASRGNGSPANREEISRPRLCSNTFYFALPFRVGARALTSRRMEEN